MLYLLAFLAQLERDFTAERTQAGMDAARKQGWHPSLQTLVQSLQKDDPKQLKALRRNAADPKTSWHELLKKYGYAIASLRRNLEHDRKKELARLATEDGN